MIIIGTQRKQLCADIKAFLKRTGISPSYFGKKATGNSEVVPRLTAGGDVTTETAERLQKFMEERK